MATSLETFKKISVLSSTPKTLSYGVKIVVCVLLATKIGCHGNLPQGIGKTGPDRENSCKYLPFREKIAKICPVYTEIALLVVKKNKKIKKCKQNIYQVGKFAERSK